MGGLTWRSGLYYAGSHTWLKRERHGSAVRVGLDGLAQHILPEVRAVNLPRPGTRVYQGEPVPEVRCGERRARISSPVEGVVTRVNPALRGDPSLVEREPYAAGWLFALAPADLLYTALPTGGSTREWFRRESTRLGRFLERDLGLAAADGGELLLPAASALRDEQWEALTRSFPNAA